MAYSDIALLGATYPAVPAVVLPKSGGGTVRFDDVSGDTVVAAAMLSGYTAHKADGTQISGNIVTKTSSDMAVNGGTVTAPAGYYASAQSKSVANGTITNNTSGGTSTGTINRGSQIKIGAGYYASDKYYTAQANSGTKNITSSGTISVDGYANVSVPKGAIIIDVTATSNTSKTISDSNITANHFVYTQTSTDPSADVSWSTSAGSITLTCSGGIPAMKLMLALNM